MKNFKLLLSIASLAITSCVAATAASADSVEFEIDAAKSTADSKVVKVYYNSDSVTEISGISWFDLYIDGVADLDTDVTLESGLATLTGGYYPDMGTYSMANEGNDSLKATDGKLLIATLTIKATDIDVSLAEFQMNGATATGKVDLYSDDVTAGELAVINAADLGTFTDGEGDPAKAFTAAAEAEGAITWYITDGTNVASKAVTEVTGGADVVVGLVATGVNAGNINYAAVTID